MKRYRGLNCKVSRNHITIIMVTVVSLPGIFVDIIIFSLGQLRARIEIRTANIE
jgi:hypothetical protein